MADSETDPAGGPVGAGPAGAGPAGVGAAGAGPVGAGPVGAGPPGDGPSSPSPSPSPDRPAERASWWARRSLRARLSAATAVVLVAAMALAAVVLVWQVRRSLIAGLDASVTQQVQAVASEARAGELPRRLPPADDGAPIVQVVDADGQVIAASAGRRFTGPMFAFPGAEDPVVRSAVVPVAGADSGDGAISSSYQVAALAVQTRRGPVTVYAALATDPVADTTDELTAALALGVPVVVAAMAVVAWLLVGRALRPVEALRRQAAAIPGTDLHRRLPEPAARDELARLANTLNELLGRIEAAGDRQRQFIADAAHELRSPIASLRAQLEVTARHPDPATAAARAAGMVSDAERLARLVDDLLALARLDADPNPPRRVVDLDDLVLREARRMRGRGPAIDATAVSGAQVVGDPAGLVGVVRNLLDNAVRHARSRVTLTLRAYGESAILVVADDGAGIAAADRERVFERFTRLDDARSRDAGGAGLGLAIVRDVVRNHGGSVRVEDNRPGARFTVTLPAAG